MAELKTKKTSASVAEFLRGVDDAGRRRDCKAVMQIMREVTGEKPKMWGPGMIGFGQYHYRYASGREGDWMLTGVAPRKQNLTVYVMSGFDGEQKLMERLGKYKTGKSCLYVRRLEDIDQAVLKELIARSVTDLRRRYGDS